MNDRRLRAIAYLRSASAAQENIDGLLHNSSVIVQLHACHEAAKRLSTDIVSVCVDVGVSGKRQERQGLTQLFDHLDRDHTLGYVITANPSRIGRDRLISAMIEQQIAEAGCTLVYADDSQPSTTRAPSEHVG